LEKPTVPDGNDALHPSGEYTLSSFATSPGWILRRNTRVLAKWTDRQIVRDRTLLRLIGRRLQTMAIDEASNSTRLAFSLGLVLETETIRSGHRGKPHWLFKSGDEPPGWFVTGGHSPQPESVAEWKRLIGCSRP
jgi:hypothetical protein